MRVFIIFICLCYVLLGGYNYVYTGTCHNNYSPVLHLKKNRLLKFTDKNPGYSIVKEAGRGKGGLFFIAEDVEDEDTNNLSARKYKLLASSFYTLSNTAFLNHQYNRIKGPRPIHSLLSNKYISQRTLRIWSVFSCQQFDHAYT